MVGKRCSLIQTIPSVCQFILNTIIEVMILADFFDKNFVNKKR